MVSFSLRITKYNTVMCNLVFNTPMQENTTKFKTSFDVAFKLRVLDYTENTSNQKQGSYLDTNDHQELEVNEAINDLST